MTTLADARTAVRRWLEDTAATPLWSDADLDAALATALARYGAWVPNESTANVIVAAGATALTVTGLEDGTAVRVVREPTGRVVPRQGNARDGESDAPAQAWLWWAGAIRLAWPATAGTWAVDWVAPRLLPAAAGGTMPVLAGDDAAVALMAAAAALRRRAAEEAKRNGPGGEALLALASAWEADAGRLVRGGRRRVRGWVAG
jgi:hypothetical protein